MAREVTQSSQPDDDGLLRLFDLSPDLFCVAGFDGYFKRVNRALVRTLGYRQEDLLTTPFLDITHPDDRGRAEQALAQLAAGEDIVGFETRVICADGSVRWLEWNTSTRPDEGFVFGVARDVTDRRLDNAQLDALRRVATLVAEGVEPQELFAVVAEEVARVVDVSIVRITHYEPDGTATECASFGTEGSLLPVGKRWSLEGANVVSMIRESSDAARINDYSGLEGEIADALRRSGVRSTVGVPIVVAQQLWGAMVVSSREPEPLPESIEPRLAGFTELLAVAIESAEGRDALSRLAEEQAALGRVATLVAQGAPPRDLFAAAAKEVDQVFGLCSTTSDVATVVRFDPGPESVLVGMSKSIEGLPLESRWQLKDLYVSTRVARTGRSARVDAPDLDAVDDPDGKALRAQRLFSQVGSPIVVDGRLWGAMTINAYERLPADTEERLEKFTELVATAIANAESRSELAASRARIVTASDEARRRIERDLHDGAQQRLVSLGLELRAAAERVPVEITELQSELFQVADGLTSALDELRELSQGIHPAILAECGLRPALKSLARRSLVPAQLEVCETRFPEPVEVAAYYVVSEALVNAAKHANASVVDVAAGKQGDILHLSIRDDGLGGADPAKGSGLIGLRDRVEALGGSIHVRSRSGVGTLIVVELPVEPDPTFVGTVRDESVASN